MAAANTDKLRKMTSQFSTTLSSSITDSDTTIACNSLSGVPTGTAVTMTIDRVDSNGTATPSKQERVVGVVSGNNLTNCVRNVDGDTAQAHSAGAVVEMIWDADTWNDAIDAFLVQHSQQGLHDNIVIPNNTYLSWRDPTDAYDIDVVKVAADENVYWASTHDFQGNIAQNINWDGWSKDKRTWVYVSATSFKISGVNVTTTYTKGTKVRFKQGGGYKYGVIASSAFSTDTTVTLIGNNDYSVANSAITDNYFSYVENPRGYPTSFTYTPTWTGESVNPAIGNGELSGRFVVSGNTMTAYIVMTAGSTTAFGTGYWMFAVPVAGIVASNFLTAGNFHCADSTPGSTQYTAFPTIFSGDPTTIVFNVSAGARNNVGAAAPFTWANGDFFVGFTQYKF